ncbi:MAG: hypothetical protein ACREA0_08675 [bacterium]
MNDESALRAKAREVIQGGTLPNSHPDRMWGGPGVGANCMICSEPAKRDELEFEIEFARNGDDPGLNTYHVHVRCFAAWEFERLNRDQLAPPGCSSGQRDG